MRAEVCEKRCLPIDFGVEVVDIPLIPLLRDYTPEVFEVGPTISRHRLEVGALAAWNMTEMRRVISRPSNSHPVSIRRRNTTRVSR